MQKITHEKCRTIVITQFDRIRIHSSIMGAMRRKSIPMTMRGGDLIRGAVFGLIDHPDYTVEVAIKRAVEMSNMPSCPETLEGAYEEMFECIDSVMREKDFYDESGKRMKKTEIVNRVIAGLAYDIKKDYCYSLVVSYLEKEKYCWSLISTELIKNMMFKKLIADDSTKECMYEYAYRKAFVDDSEKNFDKIAAVVEEYTQDVVPETYESVYEMVLNAVDHIYENN